MVDQVDSMSDAELQKKLAEHGFPVMPVTPTTRNILVQKLESVLNGKSKPRRSVDKKIEKSDLDASNAKDKPQRARAAGRAAFTMADQVDSMSDAELRRKLAEYGLPDIPVTITTRKLLANKLKSLLEGENKQRPSINNKVRKKRSFPRYSYGKESDMGVSDTKVKRMGRTATAVELPGTSVANKRGTNRRSLPRKSKEKELDLDTSNGKELRVDSKASTTGATSMLPPAVSRTGRTTSNKDLVVNRDRVTKVVEENFPENSYEEVEVVTIKHVS
ncbi:hypothetical protein K1T71_005386 [Dendrolimus kikuchii]|uniref:Uncharacterized protein n=1 Tax=Dendrolimus kikuchii TaxID=765133 RepID=A0ACC1D462_9NEOP|nr:hypothetical protein K1T71_005386 [Dendrolimus kikuchii]